MKSDCELYISEYKVIKSKKRNDLEAMTFNLIEIPDKSELMTSIVNHSQKMYCYIDILPLDFSKRNFVSIKRNSNKIVGMGWILEKNVTNKKEECIFNKLFYRQTNICLDFTTFYNGKNIQKWCNYRKFEKKKLRKLCINGIPNEMRGEVWCYLLGSEKMLYCNSNIYLEQLNNEIDKNTFNQINLDLNRTFPNSKFYDVTKESNIVCDLARVLKAFASFDYEIGYCQSINFIAAALLINMKEEVAFWTLVQLISSKRRREYMSGSWSNIEDYYKDGMKGIIFDICVLKKLCKEILPKVYEKLNEIGVDIQWFALEWFLCFFITSFPLFTSMKILDFIFCFGDFTLFNISIALLDLNKNKILSFTDTEECMIFLKNITKKSTDPSKIIRRAIKYNINEVYIDNFRKEILKEKKTD